MLIMTVKLGAFTCFLLGIVSLSCADQDSPPAGSSENFVNSLGMKMIPVEAKAFDAWHPSTTRLAWMPYKGLRPDAATNINRPRVPIRVELKKDYYLSEFPVTNKMYRQFVKETGYQAPHGKLVDFYWIKTRGAPWELEGFKGDDLPVTGVNNVDIDAFCKWLSKKEGRAYRMPLIHEFEYACRAGTDTRFWWGDHPDVRKMNYGVSQINHPTAVGSYPPNPWGFYDMLGNVWEYCFDDGPTDPDGRGRWSGRGSAFNSPQRMTGADAWSNFNEGPNLMRLLAAGFRLACDADQAAKRPGDLDKPTVTAAQPAGPSFPELEITVGKRINLGPLSDNCANFLVTKNDVWILKNRRSLDQGKTWETCPVNLTERCAYTILRNGTIMSVQGPTGPKDLLKGDGAVTVSLSRDDGKTVNTFDAPIRIPLARRFNLVRGLVELEDGRLLMTMYGHMDGDNIREDMPVGFELEIAWIKTRVIVVQSTDRGKSWQYLSTLSYHPEMGSEGQNESDIIRLSDGRLFAAMRTGIHGYIDMHGRENLDQPLLTAWSADNGRTWNDPQRVYVKNKLIAGIYPRALLTEEGVLAVLRCRLDGSVVFSPDGRGAIWSDEVIHYSLAESTDHAGMQDMALIGPNTILVIDVLRKGGWHAQGVPITVRKKK